MWECTPLTFSNVCLRPVSCCVVCVLPYRTCSASIVRP
jgi:hypothetical protein